MARKSSFKFADIANSKVGGLNKQKLAIFSGQKVTKSKYGNIKVVVDGIKFDSIGESDRYVQLKDFEKKGRISNLRLQVPYELTPSYKNEAGKPIRAMNYIADFVYFNNDTGREVVEDYKGRRTQEYVNKSKQMAIKYGIEVYETSRKHITEWRL